MLADLAHVDTWIFDLDNTLYPAKADLFALIDVKMGEFIQGLLGCDPVIARQTQKKVLAEVLGKGNPVAALKIVQDTIKRLHEGKVLKKELVVLTQLQRRPEKYVTISPHVAAAQKAIQRGKEIEVGSLIPFIITQKGKSISDKAEMEEYVKEGEYDAEYYIHHQLIPAVIKILSELGYSEEDLKQGGKQTGLQAFG